MPRAWCVSAIAEVSSPEALAAIRSGHLPEGMGEFDPARVALVETEEPARLGASLGGARGKVLADADRYQYLVSSNDQCLLVLGEVYYPWWRASVDDMAVDVVRVNHTMMGVLVPAGSHVVRLRFQPTSIWVGGAISVAGALAWIGLAMYVVSGFSRTIRART